MATIPLTVARRGLETGPTIQYPQGGGPVGQALEGVGREIRSSANQLYDVIERRNQQKENFKADAAARTFDMRMAEELETRALNMPVDGEGFHDDFMQNVYAPAKADFLASLPERLRSDYETLLGTDGPTTVGWSIKAAGKERDQTYKWFSDELTRNQEQLANAIAQNPDDYNAMLQEGMARIEASGLPTAEKMEHKKRWEKLSQISALNSWLATDPQRVIRDLEADPRLLSPTTQFGILRAAVIGQESRGDALAVSPKGAMGLMQIMPDTAKEIARELGDDGFNQGWKNDEIRDYLSNPSVNVRYGDHYLRKMIRLYAKRGGLEAALIGYNAGGARAEKWIESGFDDNVIPEETRNYKRKIMAQLTVHRGEGVGDPASVRVDFSGSNSVTDVNPDVMNRVKASFAGLGIGRIKVTSGYRNKAQNDAAGGAEGSQHLHKNAVDIDVTGYSHAERVEIIRNLSANGITGIGVGTNIIHADMGSRRTWGYKTSAGGGAVPPWAKTVTDEHMAGTLTAAGQPGVRGRFASLPYAERQQFIAQADQAVTAQADAAVKADVVTRLNLEQSVKNELATIESTGTPTGNLDDLQVSTVLGEGDYAKYLRDRETALRMFTAKDGMTQMTPTEMAERVKDYEPVPGSDTYFDDQRIQSAVIKEADRIEKLRSSAPDKAAMEYPDVRQAFAPVDPSDPRNTTINPADMQAFVATMLNRQKEFGLKPGSEAPIPRNWAIEIGKSIARIPEVAGRNLDEVQASLVEQYVELQKVFGPYTEEVILYSLREFKGVGPNTAELITGYMQAIEAGGDPLKLRKDLDRAVDADQVEGTSGGFWSGVKRFFYGEPEEDVPAGTPEPAQTPPEDAAVSPERVRRAMEALEFEPDMEADIVLRYGQRAVDAAKARMNRE